MIIKRMDGETVNMLWPHDSKLSTEYKIIVNLLLSYNVASF